MRKFLSFLEDDFVTDSLFVLLGTSLAGFFNLLYHIVSVRILSAEQYGTLNALIALVMFFSVGVSPLSTTLTRYFTEFITKNQFETLHIFIRQLFKILCLVAVALMVVFLLFAKTLGHFLNTEPTLIWLSGWIIIASLFSPITVSLLQAFQRFKLYALVGLVSVVVKLIVGALLMAFGLAVVGGLTGFTMAPLVTIAAFLLLLPLLNQHRKKTNRNVAVNIPKVEISKFFCSTALTLLAFTALTTMDVVLVKHFFSPPEAGYYSIAQMVGKITLFLPSALAIVISPKSTSAFVMKDSSEKFIYKSLAWAGLCCIIIVSLCTFFPKLVLTLLAGNAPVASIELVGVFSLAMSCYAFVFICLNYLLAIHYTLIAFPLMVMGIIQTAGILLFHVSMLAIVKVMLVCAILSFILCLILIKLSSLRRIV